MKIRPVIVTIFIISVFIASALQAETWRCYTDDGHLKYSSINLSEAEGVRCDAVGGSSYSYSDSEKKSVEGNSELQKAAFSKAKARISKVLKGLDQEKGLPAEFNNMLGDMPLLKTLSKPQKVKKKKVKNRRVQKKKKEVDLSSLKLLETKGKNALKGTGFENLGAVYKILSGVSGITGFDPTNPEAARKRMEELELSDDHLKGLFSE